MNLFLNYDFERMFPFAVLHYNSNDTKAKLHMHDYLEIVLCLEGEGQFLLPKETVEVCQGDILFINRFYNHVVVSSHSDRPIRLILILFLPAFVDSVWLTYRDKAALEQLWNDMGENIIKVNRDADCVPALTKMIKDMALAWSEKKQAYQMEIDGTLKLLLVQALRYYSQLKPNVASVDYAMRAKLQSVITHIQEHYADKLSVHDLSAMVHQSESQFRHNFKLATNMNFKKYLGYVRISKVINLLISTDMSVTEVAAQAGFSNINQFYLLFREYTSMSPAEYRQRNKGIFLVDD